MKIAQTIVLSLCVLKTLAVDSHGLAGETNARIALAQGPGHCTNYQECETIRGRRVSVRDARDVDGMFEKFHTSVSAGDYEAAANLFCPSDGELFATVSDHIRTSPLEIRSYFEYFAQPDNTVVSSCSRIRRDSNIFVDNRNVQWSLGGSITCVRMSFTLRQKPTGRGNRRDYCIQTLHSSVFPVEPEGLQEIDRKNNLTWTN